MTFYYFAYGSNMNPRRMAERGMRFVAARAGVLDGWRLRFNKRASGKSGIAHANIVRSAQDCVEGVLYQLVCSGEITRMDPFEGFPRLYGRQPMPVMTAEQREPVQAWVYVATPEWQADGLLPERHYLNHLLAGRPWLSNAYYRSLTLSQCAPETGPGETAGATRA